MPNWAYDFNVGNVLSFNLKFAFAILFRLSQSLHRFYAYNARFLVQHAGHVQWAGYVWMSL
jgi:hypothetical protein